MHITELSQKEVITKAYNEKHPVIITIKNKNKRDCLIVDYTDEDITFIWNNKRITEKQENAHINILHDDHWFRDMICKQEFNMTWEQLQNHIERAYRNNECSYEQIGYKYGASSAKKIYITVNNIMLTAAMTYGTVTGVRLEDGTMIWQNYSVTSTQWQNRIL